jgi:hypothetical protein
VRTDLDDRAAPEAAPTRLAPPPAARPAAPDVVQALAAVDRGFHFAALFGRAGAYVLLALAADRFDFGPHVLAGVLFGDFAGFAAGAARELRAAPAAAAAEFALFALLFAIWWHRYEWPVNPEFRALFFLAAFGVFVGRLGLASHQLFGVRSGWE